MKTLHPWFKSWKGVALLMTLAVVVSSAVFYLLSGTASGIPVDKVETIVVHRENEPSFNLSLTSEEGRRLLLKCEDVLSNLSGHAKGVMFDDEVAEVREKYAHVEIIFKENYDVPISVRLMPPMEDRVAASRVLFVLSGEPPEGYRGSVLFRAVEPRPWDNNTTFAWGIYSVFREDQVGWSIFQELVSTVNEIQGP